MKSKHIASLKSKLRQYLESMSDDGSTVAVRIDDLIDLVTEVEMFHDWTGSLFARLSLGTAGRKYDRPVSERTSSGTSRRERRVDRQRKT